MLGSDFIKKKRIGKHNMKRIVIMTHHMTSGGCERVIAQLANWFVENNFECTIMTEYNSGSFYKLDDRIELYSLSDNKNYESSNMLTIYRKFRKAVKYKNADIVLAMPEKVNVWSIIALLGLKIPVVVSERNNPWLHPQNKIKRIMRKLFYPFASGYIFQTKQAASYFSRKVKQKGVVLPNPLDISQVPEPWKGERRKEVVGVGRLENQKNFPLLIKAFAEFHRTHPDYVLTIYGEGSKRDELDHLAASLLPRNAYSLPGSTKELMENIKGVSMFVLSSNYEGLPNVLIEAMAVGIPVVSTDCPSGGPGELIENENNGLLIPVDDHIALYKAMEKIADSPNLGEKFSHNSLEIKKTFDSKLVIEQWRKYLELCSKQK
ncbi:glycosyltransferase family 4 protein [Bacillus sp. NTK071]|uniref:glycosyltransferase family 4 protein n=1 Tax=Bacillus sp. NTK071 TaxID=2802175 RepID=UPI001A8E68DE|nr:glycosyltransferase family 4 protein [Bacillus sp. NTK071]MBN8210243.1 glycosyltransferase family 4 protein [Bacillus sp. NTK071]